MKKITKNEFEDYINNSFCIFTDNFIYVIVFPIQTRTDKRIFISFSSKVGKSNERNYIKRVLRTLFQDLVLEKKILLIVKTNLDKHGFKKLSYNVLKQEFECVSEFFSLDNSLLPFIMYI